MSITAITLTAPERLCMIRSAGGSAVDVGLWKLSCTLADGGTAVVVSKMLPFILSAARVATLAGRAITPKRIHNKGS